MVLQIAALLGLTIVALGIGVGSGIYLNGTLPAPPTAVEEAAPGDGHGGGDGHGTEEPSNAIQFGDMNEELGIVHLEPITTNLAGPTGTWVRLELALVFDGGSDARVAQAIQQDFLAYMRTVKIYQIEGASGFQHLKSDLEERASLRSGGKVTGILIRTLLFE